jgi:hypothetical protein
MFNIFPLDLELTIHDFEEAIKIVKPSAMKEVERFIYF